MAERELKVKLSDAGYRELANAVALYASDLSEHPHLHERPSQRAKALEKAWADIKVAYVKQQPKRRRPTTP